MAVANPRFVLLNIHNFKLLNINRLYSTSNFLIAMSLFICRSCRASRQALRLHKLPVSRTYFSNTPSKESQDPKQPINVVDLLSTPSWSVKELLDPHPASPADQYKIEPKLLHHLLRLSALPMPKSPEEEQKMLKTLEIQRRFVSRMQMVDTEGVEPLQSIRDETTKGRQEATIGLKELRGALEKEDIKGRSRRPRRRREVVNTKGVEDWDVLGTAGEKVKTPGGNYFVVRSGKDKAEVNE